MLNRRSSCGQLSQCCSRSDCRKCSPMQCSSVHISCQRHDRSKRKSPSRHATHPAANAESWLPSKFTLEHGACNGSRPWKVLSATVPTVRRRRRAANRQRLKAVGWPFLNKPVLLSLFTVQVHATILYPSLFVAVSECKFNNSRNGICLPSS